MRPVVDRQKPVRANNENSTMAKKAKTNEDGTGERAHNLIGLVILGAIGAMLLGALYSVGLGDAFIR